MHCSSDSFIHPSIHSHPITQETSVLRWKEQPNGFNCPWWATDRTRPSQSNDKQHSQVNTNQFVHFAGAGFHPVLHCDPPSLRGVIDSCAAGSALSEVPTSLEQLDRQEREGKTERGFMREGQIKDRTSKLTSFVQLSFSKQQIYRLLHQIHLHIQLLTWT